MYLQTSIGRNNHKGNIKIGGDHPELKKEPKECAPHIQSDVCTTVPGLKRMKEFLYNKNSKLSNKNMSPNEIVETLKDMLNVESESGIWNHSEFRRYVDTRLADNILKENFKPKGPGTWGSTALLDNFNIDESLQQWAKVGPTVFKKKFHHIPFQMIDFEDRKTELATTYFPDIVKNYDCFGVVLNTDVSTGPGKHWFCIYGDFTKKGSSEDPHTLEFFNSSGNPPTSEVHNWLESTQHQILKDTGKRCKIVIAAPKRLQDSKTECGMWSLLYIQSRLKGYPPNWFYKVKVNDNDMIELRKHLFRRY